MSSPARRPHAFNWSYPPWSSRAAAQSPSPYRLRERRERRGRFGVLLIRSSPRPPPPGFARPAVGSSQAADQMGITRQTRGRPLSPARPIPAEEEVTSALRTPACRLGWGRGWLRATSAGGGCSSPPELPTMVRCLGRRWGPWAARGDCRRQRAERSTQVLGAGCRLWGPTGQEAGAGCCQLAQLARVAAQSHWLEGRPPLQTQAPEGALRLDCHSWAPALGA